MNTFYIWSGQDLLGSVSEVNFSTAKQKALILARLLRREAWALSTSAVYGRFVIVSGSVASRNHSESSKFMQIAKNLTQAA
jgi:hypothetical protein